MALTRDQLIKRFADAAGKYPGMQHVLFSWPSEGLRAFNQKLPDELLRPTHPNEDWYATYMSRFVSVYALEHLVSREFPDELTYSHSSLMGLTESKRHDWQGDANKILIDDQNAERILWRLSPSAIQFIPASMRIAGLQAHEEWLLYLQIRMERSPYPIEDGAYTRIDDIFLESVNALEELEELPHDVEHALRKAGLTGKPLALLEMMWGVPSVRVCDLVPQVWDDEPTRGAIATTVNRANKALSKIGSPRTLSRSNQRIAWSGHS